jgi:hypothetical protein
MSRGTRLHVQFCEFARLVAGAGRRRKDVLMNQACSWLHVMMCKSGFFLAGMDSYMDKAGLQQGELAATWKLYRSPRFWQHAGLILPLSSGALSSRLLSTR